MQTIRGGKPDRFQKTMGWTSLLLCSAGAVFVALAAVVGVEDQWSMRQARVAANEARAGIAQAVAHANADGQPLTVASLATSMVSAPSSYIVMTPAGVCPRERFLLATFRDAEGKVATTAFSDPVRSIAASVVGDSRCAIDP